MTTFTPNKRYTNTISLRSHLDGRAINYSIDCYTKDFKNYHLDCAGVVAGKPYKIKINTYCMARLASLAVDEIKKQTGIYTKIINYPKS